MSANAVAWAVKQRTGSPTTKSVLVFLANCHRDDASVCSPSIADLARETELSERAVRRSLKELEVARFIERDRQRNGGLLGGYAYRFPHVSAERTHGPVATQATRESRVVEPNNRVATEADGRNGVAKRKPLQTASGHAGHRPDGPDAPRAREQEQVLDLRTKPPSVETPNGVSPSADDCPSTAQQILSDYIDVHGRPPSRTVGQLAQQIKLLVGEGFSSEAIAAGLSRMAERRILTPSLLPNFVAEAALPTPKPRSNGKGRSFFQAIKDYDEKHPSAEVEA